MLINFCSPNAFTSYNFNINHFPITYSQFPNNQADSSLSPIYINNGRYLRSHTLLQA